MKKAPKTAEPTVEPITNSVEEQIPPAPPVEPITPPPTVRKNTALFPLLFLVLVAAGLIVAFPDVQNIVSQAASKKCQPIARVMINPGSIETMTNSKATELSVMAYDKYNMPVKQGVKYDWGISSTNSVGTVKARHDLATFIPSNVGMGDLYVKTTNNCTKNAVIGSAKVIVKQGIAPTPTTKKRK